MPEENQSKPVRQVLLTSDQFEINERGEVVIKSDEVVQALRSQLESAEAIEAGSITTIDPINFGIGHG